MGPTWAPQELLANHCNLTGFRVAFFGGFPLVGTVVFAAKAQIDARGRGGVA